MSYLYLLFILLLDESYKLPPGTADDDVYIDEVRY